MRRSGFALVVVCALVLAPTATVAAGATAPAAAGSIGVRLLDVPSQAGSDPRARLYVVDHLAPGTVIHRRIQVTNTSHADTAITVYPAAATIGHGVFQGAAGHTPNDLSTWTTVDPTSVTVLAGTQTQARVTIAVPRDAAAGERYGVVWAETRSAPSAGGVTEVNRVGVRLYISVGPGGPPAADFTIDSLTAERNSHGSPLVMATVTNTGGRALDLSGTLDLKDGPAGLQAGPFAASLGVTLAVGDTEPVTIALDNQLPAGPWQARVTLHSGLLQRSGHAVITFPTTGSAAVVPTSRDGSRWLIWSILGLLGFVGAMALLASVRRGRSDGGQLRPRAGRGDMGRANV